MFSLADKEEICSRLRTYRKQAGIAQDGIPGLTQQTISNWEKGDLPKQIIEFGRFALAINETPDTLLLVEERQKNVAKARAAVPAESHDTLLEITMALVELDTAALREGSEKEAGPLPSRIFCDHLNGVKSLLQRGGLGGESQELNEPQTQQEVARQAKDALGEFLTAHAIDFPKEDFAALKRAATLIERIVVSQSSESGAAVSKDHAEDKPKASKAVVKLHAHRKKDRS